MCDKLNDVSRGRRDVNAMSHLCGPEIWYSALCRRDQLPTHGDFNAQNTNKTREIGHENTAKHSVPINTCTSHCYGTLSVVKIRNICNLLTQV